jgi:hypothetical protein
VERVFGYSVYPGGIPVLRKGLSARFAYRDHSTLQRREFRVEICGSIRRNRKRLTSERGKRYNLENKDIDRNDLLRTETDKIL